MSRRVTKKQEWFLNLIINQTGLIVGSELTYENVYKFIQENIIYIDFERGKKEYNNYKKYYNFPTEKQWDLIEQIEKRTELEFEGNSFEEANKFIKKYKECRRRDLYRPATYSNEYEVLSYHEYCNSNNFSNKERGYCEYTGAMSYEARIVEDVLNRGIFYSGGVSVISDDGRSYL